MIEYAKVIKMKQTLRSSAALLLATIIWGSAFVAQSVGMDYIEPFTFQAVRCFLAVIGLLPVIFLIDKRQGKSFLKEWCSKRLWIGGTLCAIPLFLAVNLQQIGIVSTSAGKSAFLTAMYIVIVPLIGIFLKRKPSPIIPVCVGLAVAGLYCLSCVGAEGFQFGDLCLIICAFMFAVQIIFVDRFAPGTDSLRLNLIQALVCAVLSSVLMFTMEAPDIRTISMCALPLCYAGFLSMGLAYSLQIIGQKQLEPTVASLIMSLESVFAVLFGAIILHETMTFWETVGCVLVFAAVILSQIPIPVRKGAVH